MAIQEPIGRLHRKIQWLISLKKCLKKAFQHDKEGWALNMVFLHGSALCPLYCEIRVTRKLSKKKMAISILSVCYLLSLQYFNQSTIDILDNYFFVNCSAAVIHGNLSALLLRLGREEEAVFHARQAVRLSPKWSKVSWCKN